MKFLFIAIIPFFFSFSDLKIGGTIFLDPTIKLKNLDNLKLTITILDDKKIVAETKVKMPKFPQAFVLTQRHVIDPKIHFKGSYDIFIDLADVDGNKVYQKVDKATVGKQDLKIIVGK